MSILLTALLTILFAVGPSPAFADQPYVADGSDKIDAQTQYDAGEFGAATEAALATISDIESKGRPFHPSIVDQYRVLGDAYLALGNADDALGAFSLARQELRMLGGLHAPDQLDLLYREAHVYHRINDIKSANDRHEYAFNLQRNGSLADQIDATIRLAEWYELNRHESAARDLYRHALRLSDADSPNNTVARARLYRAIAWTYRSQYYPGKKATDAKTPHRVLTPKPYGIVWRDIEKMTIDPWSREILLRARISLQRSRDALVEQENLPVGEMSQTLLDLGDWHLLTRKYGRAFATYADLYKLLQSHDPSRLESLLGRAELLHMRDLGSAVAIPGHTSPKRGVIELEVAVNRMGVARDIRTVHLDPPYLSDRRFRAALRTARFRPAIIDGAPTHTDNVRVTYHFD